MVKIFQMIVRGDYKLLNILSYALKYNIIYIAVTCYNVPYSSCYILCVFLIIDVIY